MTITESPTCLHCGRELVAERIHGRLVLVDDTGGDVCGSWGTFTNEPHVTSDPGALAITCSREQARAEHEHLVLEDRRRRRENSEPYRPEDY